MIKNDIEQYFNLKYKIINYFGYDEINLDDIIDYCPNYHWFIYENKHTKYGYLIYSDELFTIETFKKRRFYSCLIHQKPYPNLAIYRKKDLTLVSVNISGCDYLMILDNEKECKNKEIIDFHYTKYNSNWTTESL